MPWGMPEIDDRKEKDTVNYATPCSNQAEAGARAGPGTACLLWLAAALALPLLVGSGACTGDAPAKAPSPEGSPVVAGNTAFAIDLYKQLAAKPGNLFFSPLSLSSALAMTYAGARGETAGQMADVLHFSADQAALHQGLAALTRDLNVQSGGHELSIANALWGQKGEGFLDAYLAALEEHYGAGLREVDFAADAQGARKTINTWVAKQTMDKIRELLRASDIDPATRLVLTNAIYFKGLWLEPFDKRHTKDAAFHVSPDETVTVPMMELTKACRHYQAKGFQAIELPYKGDALSMVIVLPQAVNGLAALERSLTPDTVAQAVTGMQERTVVVNLPRFKATTEVRLQETLAQMGMPLAFSPQADFSGINGKKDLFISAVVHQATVDVNEEGAEAAAATAVVMKRGAPPPRFVADHPFLFLIRDRRSDSILFLGRVANPMA